MLFIKLNLPGDRQGVVHSIVLNGRVIGVEGTWGRDRPVAMVLGGHYFPGEASTAGFYDRIALKAQTRCEVYHLQLPGVVQHAAPKRAVRTLVRVYPEGDDRENGSHEKPCNGCERPLCQQKPGTEECIYETMTVMLSRDRGRRPVEASLELPALPHESSTGSVAGSTSLELEGVKRARGDSHAVPLRLSEIRFGWQDRCEYPSSPECPSARLVEPGTACANVQRAGQGSEQCWYRCQVPATAAAFRLPVTVRFDLASADDSWTETLSYVDQVLTGFTAAASRRFELRMNRTAALYRSAADTVRSVRLSTPSGLSYELSDLKRLVLPYSPSRVKVPGGECGYPIQYRYVGDRQYVTRNTQIEDGVIELAPPRDAAVEWSPGFLVAVASANMWTLPRKRVERPTHSPGVMLSWSGRYRPAQATQMHSFELGVTTLLRQTNYYPLDGLGSSKRQDAEHAWTLHTGPELSLSWSVEPLNRLGGTWVIGMVGGGGIRTPLLAGDVPFVEKVQGYGTGGIMLRLRLGRGTWAELTARGYLERVRRFVEEPNALLGELTTKELWSATLFVGVGLRHWL